MPKALSQELGRGEEQMQQLASDGLLKNNYTQFTLLSFWMKLQNVYSVLTEKVLMLLFRRWRKLNLKKRPFHAEPSQGKIYN